jgi:Lipid A 3-O-deacylase (PagL)
MGICVDGQFSDQPHETRSSINNRSRHPWNVLCPKAGLALLVLLPMAAALEAQSVARVGPDWQESNSRAEPPAKIAVQALDAADGFNTPPSSTQASASPTVTDPGIEVASSDWPGDFLDGCVGTPSSERDFGDLSVSPQASDAQGPSPAEAKKKCKQERRAAARLRDLADPNRNIYYGGKLEFGLDVGYLPINIPFAFDVFLGDGYNKTPLNYTLVPVIASIRWHFTDISGISVFRGNWDAQCSFGAVAIPRGPESHYFAWILGLRRNFVPRSVKVAPYFDFRVGLGGIDAKGPLGVQFAQGQDFTFTLNVGSGVRYNFSQKYSLSAGLHYMHISNLYLSQPKFPDYGINVYGPMVGIDVRFGRPHKSATE